jgi:hypothetical protein
MLTRFRYTSMYDLLDTHQAARRCNLARQTLAKLRVTGGGCPFIKLGSKVLYRSDELDAWIQSNGRRRSTSDAGARCSVRAV